MVSSRKLGHCNFFQAGPNIRCVKRRLLKWVLWWGAAGLVVPGFAMLGAQIGELTVVLWPMSYMFQALADAPTPVASAEIVEIWAIGIASNVILYALIGSVTSPVVYLATRHRKVA